MAKPSISSSRVPRLDCEVRMGMGILPELALERVSGNVNVYPFDQRFYRTICLVVNSEQAKAPSTAKMIAAITAYVAHKYPDKVLQHPHVG